MTIHKNGNGTFCISAYGTWRPGIYSSEKACRIAQRRPDCRLTRLQALANLRDPESGVITEDDLKQDKPAVVRAGWDE